jgi:arylsulfatase A-like enzyme
MSNQPNILFLFPDQLRFDWIAGSPAIPVRTPNLDGLRQRGTTFTKTIVPSPLCAPCRGALALGVEYDKSPVQSNEHNIPHHAPTFYKLLRDAGYHVMGCGKFDLNKGDCTSRKPAWGIDGKRHLDSWGFSDGINNEGKMDGANSGREKPQGPYLQFLEDRGLRQTHLDDFSARERTSSFPTALPDDAYCDNWIGQNGLDLIDSVPVGKPWFLQVNYNGPHNPWDITPSMKSLYEGVRFPDANANEDIPPVVHQDVRRNYSAMVENIDRWTGLFLEKLTQRGELENTLIVFSSDHGEMLGDQNKWGKTHPNHPSVSVPLVIAGPTVIHAETNDPTTILDLPATFLDYANASLPKTMDSRSLRPFLEGQTTRHRDVVFSGLRNWRMVYDGRYKYIEGYKDTPQFFDLETDPLENHDLSTDPNADEQRYRLKAYLQTQ